MKKILVLTPEDVAGGFAIAGVMQRQAGSSDQQEQIDRALDDGRIGVLAIDERLVDSSTQERLRDAEQHWSGAIVVVPAPGRPSRPEDDYAMRLIRRAIGYQVRVQL